MSDMRIRIALVLLVIALAVSAWLKAPLSDDFKG